MDLEFLTQDRITKIRYTYEQLNLETESYIAFSGGKDSTVLHYIIDEAIPNNKIPRVYMNTGMEYTQVINFVKSFVEKDERFIILPPSRNIREVLEKYGYPCKSKEHSANVDRFNHGSFAKSIQKYLARPVVYEFKSAYCPKKLLHHFAERGKYNYSEKCCKYLKKNPQNKWARQNDRPITITGMRKAEEGKRRFLDCLNPKKTRFAPLAVCSDEWENYYIETRKIQLCELYYPPYSFHRTGCLACPFAQDIQTELNKLAVLLPEQRKRAEILWGDVYDDYREHDFRIHGEKPLHYRERFKAK